MTLIKSLILAFSMFSTLPMPKVDWNSKNMAYMMGFFPFVGLFISFSVLAWLFFAFKISFLCSSLPAIFFDLPFMILPFLISGGIHMDGFMDTCDALASHADKEKKLEILKDSHSGAFAVLGCVFYVLSYYLFSRAAVANILDDLKGRNFSWLGFLKSVLPYTFSFIFSRSLSALALFFFPKAKKKGLLYTFSDSCRKITNFLNPLIFIIFLLLLLFFIEKILFLIILSFSISIFLFYFLMTKRNFGGITGDTAGWFLQIYELSYLILTLFYFSI